MCKIVSLTWLGKEASCYFCNRQTNSLKDNCELFFHASSVLHWSKRSGWSHSKSKVYSECMLDWFVQNLFQQFTCNINIFIASDWLSKPDLNTLSTTFVLSMMVLVRNIRKYWTIRCMDFQCLRISSWLQSVFHLYIE